MIEYHEELPILSIGNNGYFHIAFSAMLCIFIVLAVLALATFYLKLHKRE